MNERKAEVWLDAHKVGTIAETASHRFAFAYSEEWLDSGFAISPFSLPVEPKVFVPAGSNFQGLWGVFADSLPDAWGRLLVDRMLRSKGLSAETVSPLTRLMIVGASGMGALSYRPAWDMAHDTLLGDLDELSAQCSALLNREDVSNLDDIFRLAGSSGGVRPKVMTEDWIIKFPAAGDIRDSGLMEKEYMDAAAECGMIVPETKLMPSRRCGGYFAVRRFDRRMGKRLHMLTASALLEVEWHNAALDYHTIMKLTGILSRGNMADMVQMYRRMCFNVFAHNRDDHAKNFTWIYDAKNDCWHPSPAYDLTWSTTYYGEHTTTVDGNGRDPGMSELLAVGKKAGLGVKTCREIAEEIQEKTMGLAGKYRNIR